jgi:transcription antitermination factor NusG
MSGKRKDYRLLIPDKPDTDEITSIVSADTCLKQWYVIRTKPRQEQVCLRELARIDVEALCPLRLEYRFRRRCQEAVPLFPGYVFCQMIFPDDYHSVRWLKGVLHLVQFGNAAPPSLDEEIMNFFIESMDENGVVQTDPDLVVGDKVEFLMESLKGLIGTVVRINSAEKRVKVLMDLLYQATVEVEIYQVQSI